ncbi:CoA transferase [Acrocarpospora macrocephala]|uniref:CoA transferase n=1 Tax=Acrocarpospora macrocephala TaxID=150177 RepID=A0A5M3WTZ9_9ACTN|nr:CaiB/BaiF CoA-transferase family protein [Acrocarpospora macrocephala]GES09618.1 CoA transferase [Acrocarpospora macrocephala]
MTTPEDRPLAGVRILALEQMLALPVATQILARLGADVVKIEPPGGDGGRASRPTVADRSGAQVGATFIRGNAGKRSIVVDLKQPEGVALVHALLPRFDVFAENLRPGVARRLGVDQETVASISPSTLYLSVSGFGNSGSPYAAWPAFAAVGEAIAGLYELRRPEGELPRVGAGGAIGDLATALYATIGILAGLRQRERTGIGGYVDIAMADAALAMNDMGPNLWSMNAPDVAKGRNIGVLTAFAAKEGHFVVSVIREHLWKRFAETVGHPEWLTDERLRTRADWSARVDDVIRPGVEAWAADKSKQEAASLLAAAGVPAAPSNEAADVAADPHYATRSMLHPVQGLATDDVLVVGDPVKFLGTAEPAPGPLPVLGEHTGQILRDELGLAPEEIERLAETGVVTC